jgi:hypothetical protein
VPPASAYALSKEVPAGYTLDSIVCGGTEVSGGQQFAVAPGATVECTVTNDAVADPGGGEQPGAPGGAGDPGEPRGAVGVGTSTAGRALPFSGSTTEGLVKAALWLLGLGTLFVLIGLRRRRRAALGSLDGHGRSDYALPTDARRA